MLQRILTNMLNRWAWLILTLFLAFTTQPCRHESGQACLHLSKGSKAQAFGLYAIQVKHQALDTSASQLCLPVSQPLAYDDSLSDRNQPIVRAGLP